MDASGHVVPLSTITKALRDANDARDDAALVLNGALEALCRRWERGGNGACAAQLRDLLEKTFGEEL